MYDDLQILANNLMSAAEATRAAAEKERNLELLVNRLSSELDNHKALFSELKSLFEKYQF